MNARLFTLLVVTPLTQKFDPRRPALNSDGEVVELKDRLGTLPLFRKGSICILQPGLSVSYDVET